MAHIEEEAMSQGAYYFRHTYESAPEESRRGLVDHEGALCIPVLGTFMRDELDLH
ncbi:MAG TPA: hypothetical protein VGF49_10680 [Candidatus Solibacter sp.]